MKKIIWTLLFFPFVIYAQPVLINSTDIPVPSGGFNNILLSPGGPASPASGSNQVWDYSTFTGTLLVPNSLVVETDPLFTAAGIDINTQFLKDLNTAAGYIVTNEIDFNANAVIEKGIKVDYQAYELSSITGNSQDSIIFPAQKYLLSDSLIIMQFPFTANSSWHSTSRRNNNFLLTVASYGLNQTPGEHVYTTHRNDSIVGWGTLRVHTSTGPSIWYDVLMNQYEEYSIDSFYLSGSPAPAPLLTAFSVSQGQKSNAKYGYDFYRTGSFNYLVRFDYGTDSTFSFLQASYQNIDNILHTDKIDGVYSTVLFPNPVNADMINIKFEGKYSTPHKYEIINNTGKIVQSGTVSNTNRIVQIQLQQKLSAGTYSVNVFDNTGKKLLHESFIKLN